jgi:solute:Na+ symporter, SSS family
MNELRWLDLLAILMYLSSMAGMAVYFARRNTSTEEYFVGGRRFAGWVIGISMLGTIVSSATFLALPAAAYALDWRQLAVNFALPIVAIMAVLVFIPLFRHGNATTAFEYLGLRFGTVPRVYGTLSFIVMQSIRAAQVLFLLSLAIQALTGAPLYMVIIGAGAFVAFYTVVGGIDTVIWTDVVQTVVLLLGGFACAATIIFSVPGGLAEVIQVGVANEKFSLGSLEWNFSERTFWTVTLLGVVNWLAIYGGDQNMVQRYVAARSTREARKATIIYSSLALPMWAFFFFVGTSLFVYFRAFPDASVANMPPDQVLPYFIVHHIPSGIAGLIIAAIIAAAMSTLDSSLNAIATVTVVDLLRPHLGHGQTDSFYLGAARWVTLLAAILMILGALVLEHLPKESMNDISLMATSIFGGCLMGLFMLGFFTRRVDGISASWALAAAMLFNITLALGALEFLPVNWRLQLHIYWIGAIVNISFMGLAYGLALIRGSQPQTLEGLTVWSIAATAQSPEIK